MADSEIPNKLLPALRSFWWVAPPFIFFLVAVERFIEGYFYQGGICLILCFLSILIAVYWEKIIPFRFQTKPQKLEYLHHKDSELGSAIRDMVWRSAWARWYAAQQLVNTGKPTTEEHLLQVASSNVLDNLTDGSLEVRGRLPGSMEYEIIPRTHWRSSALHFKQDPITLWRMLVIPRGGAEFTPDGVVKAHNRIAEQRNAVIQNYDSLIVDAYQFEKLWPKRDHLADRKRRQFLRAARKRGLDKDEIQKLSQD